MVKPTPAQQQIIDFPIGREVTRSDLLVSASAGSGKTATLVNRVLAAIEKGINLDELLIVTFTNAAAAEMRERIEKQLRLRLTETTVPDGWSQEDVWQRHLMHQLTVLPSAKISTIDAFAIDLIDDYYQVIDLDPVYRLLADQTERELLMQDVVDDLFEASYADQDEHFLQLVANFGSASQDDRLRELLIRLYDIAETRPAASEWLQQLDQPYQREQFVGDLLTSDYFARYFRAPIEQTLEQVRSMIQKILDSDAVMADEETTEKQAAKVLAFWQAYLSIITRLQTLLGNGKWDELKVALNTEWPRASHPKGEAAKQQTTKVLKTIKQLIESLQTGIFAFDEATTKALIDRGRELTRALSELALRFKTQFDAKKRQEHLLDFSDLTQFALQISDDPQVAEQLHTQFIEVMVDEYQDINPLQQRFLENIGADKLFMVGDVKQSIYRFRQADPKLFNAKYNAFGSIQPDAEPLASGSKIELLENFRSVPNVIDFVNAIFEQLMIRETGGIDYVDETHQTSQALVLGNPRFDEQTPRQAGLLIAYTKAESDQPSANARQAEIDLLVKKIQQLIGEGHLVDGDGQQRPITFRDIAVLSRSRSWDIDVMSALRAAQIPVNASENGNYYQTMEMSIMLDYLRVIDNPHQDIPLAAVLRSPIFGLDENDLARIRLADDTPHDFFTALQALHAQQLTDTLGQKVASFFDDLAVYRQLATQNRLDRLIWEIYERTGWLEYVGGIPGGKQRQANLKAFHIRAQEFQTSNFVGLFKFIRYIERLQEDDKDIGAVGAQSSDNAVQLMTIHGSKGLEFPIVFLMNAEKQFNLKDTQGDLLVEPDLGVALSVVDRQNELSVKTLPQFALKQAITDEVYAEEMRLLYVALTRAEQQIYVVGSYPDETALIDHWHLDEPQPHQTQLTAATIQSGNAYLDWIGTTLARTTSARQALQAAGIQYAKQITLPSAVQFELAISPASELVLPAEDQANQPLVPAVLADDELQALRHNLSIRYPYGAATQMPAAQTVSEAKTYFDALDPDRVDTQTEVVVKKALSDPQFMQDDVTQQPASARGTATHLILERLNWQQTIEPQIDVIVDHLISEGLIDKQVKPFIPKTALTWFAQSDLAQRLKAENEHLLRERPFSLLVPANELYQAQEKIDDQVLIHGRIDGYLVNETQQTITLFDYKTDAVSELHQAEQIDQIINRYRGQLALYARALQQLYPGYTIEHQYLILLSPKQIIEL